MSGTVSRIVTALRSLALLGVGNYGAMSVSLAINAVLTRRLGVESFGRLALMMSLSQMASLVVVGWSHSGLIRFGAHENASTGSVHQAFWARTWIVMPWTVLAVLGAVLARDWLASYLAIPVWAVSLIVAHFLAGLALTTIGGLFQARNDMSRYGAALFLDKAVMGALLLLAPHAWTGDPLTVLGLYAASSLGVAMWGMRVVGARSFFPVVFDRAAYHRMLWFSLPLAFSSWAGLLGTNWFDLMIIKWYRPVSEVGLYSLGTVLAGVVQQVTILFSVWLLPQMSMMVAEGEHERIRRLVERAFPYWFLATSLLFAVVAAAAGAIVPLLFGSTFAPSGTVLSLLMPAACALALFNAFSPLVTALGSTWMLTGICLASGAVNVALDLVLIPSLGIQGAALATVIAYSTSAILTLSFVRRRLRWPVFRLAWFSLPVVVVSGGLMFLTGPVFYLVAGSLAAIVLFCLARAFDLFRRDDVVFVADLRTTPQLARGVSLAAGRRQ